MPPVTPASQSLTHWRSLDEVADSPQFRRFVEHEFPGHEDALDNGFSRRQFIQLMGASMLLAGGLAGCRRWPEHKLAPFTSRPEGRVPGEAEYYATAMELDGVAKPLLVKTIDGRPIKIEGNPQHPASMGAADLLAQASILELYDPTRSQSVLKREGGKLVASDWAAFFAFSRPHFAALRVNGGQGLAVMAEPTSSPTVEALAASWRAAFPQARWCVYAPAGSFDNKRGNVSVRTVLHLDKAKVIACFDADLLLQHPDGVRHTRDFVQGRRSVDASGKMNRLYVAESTLSVTGTMADDRLAVRSGDIPAMLSALSRRIKAPDAPAGVPLAPEATAFVSHLAADLLAHRGEGLLVAGPTQPPGVHALVSELNRTLGNDQTADLIDVPELVRDNSRDLAALLEDMKAGKIDTLVLLGVNPIYDAPSDWDFAATLSKVPHAVHLGSYVDETAQACAWHVNRAHYLEAWGDARAWDGTPSIVQPMLQPLFDGKSLPELLAVLSGEQEADGYALVRRTWAQLLPMGAVPLGDFEKAWRRILHDGFFADGHSYVREEPGLIGLAPRMPATTAPSGPGTAFELVFFPDRKLHDGRFANNGWLQELPDPITKIVWDNAAILSPTDARELGVEHGDVIEIIVRESDVAGLDQRIEAPVFVLPGQARHSIAIALGYGRTAAGPVGSNVGVNANVLRTAKNSWTIPGVTVRKTGKRYQLVTTQDHWAMDKVGMETRAERIPEFVRELPLAAYLKSAHEEPAANSEGKVIPLQLWTDPVQYKDDPTVEYMWGMAVDLNSCTGCNACVLACQAENNIPIVGKDQAARGREMHWIRIDRYFKGDAEAPDVQAVHQPVACVQCENAPCEQVCPVAATTHSHEGLNMMVYNRCVGTRYCSNNCPYKVRRFNYFDWHAHDPRRTTPTPPWLGIPDQQSQVVDQITRMLFNPDVTVRSRGVMEKCTYCVQRIEAGRITAKNEGRSIRDGEVTPACAQTCPAEAIVFGNIKDPNSKVRRLQDSRRAYGLLAELNVRPRTQYLAKIRNPGATPPPPSKSQT